MTNHIHALLNVWYPLRKECEWVLATVIDIDGSSYRKPGAMMLLNSLGQYYGLVSGGCLESDIMRKARQCLSTNENLIASYDMREEDDIAWQLGIGCGGKIDVLLQAISAENDWLYLDKVYALLNQKQACRYSIKIATGKAENKVDPLSTSEKISKNPHFRIKAKTQNKIEITLSAPTHLAVFGGGVDAQPLVQLASGLGWTVSVFDHRTTYARKSDFPTANMLVRKDFADLKDEACLQQIDAAVVMGHNVDFDAKALRVLQKSSASYLGLLGPSHRCEKVLQKAQCRRQDFNQIFSSPIGLNLGGDLPESIALSVLAEIHAFIHEVDAQSHSNVLGDLSKSNKAC